MSFIKAMLNFKLTKKSGQVIVICSFSLFSKRRKKSFFICFPSLILNLLLHKVGLRMEHYNTGHLTQLTIFSPWARTSEFLHIIIKISDDYFCFIYILQR